MSGAQLADVVGAWRSGRTAEAERLARALVARDPALADGHRIYSEILAASGDLWGARQSARRVLELAPQDVAAHRRLADLDARAGDLEAAAATLGRALALEPGNTRTLNNLGNVLIGLGRFAEAIERLAHAVALDPGYATAFLNLGVAHARAGRLLPSIDAYRHALALNPALTEASLNLGSALSRAGRHAEALDSYAAALRLAPSLLPARLGRAQALLTLERPAEALLAARELLSAHPGDSAALTVLGFAELRNGRAAEALAAFESALRQAPQLAKAHAGRADALKTLGRSTEALEAYQRATTLDPADCAPGVSCGNMLMRLGNVRGARAAFEAVLALEPRNVAALEGRAITYVVIGPHEEADQALLALEAEAPGLDYLAGNRFQAQRYVCKWRDYEATYASIAARVAAGERADLPLGFLSHNADPALQRACAAIYVADKLANIEPVMRSAPRSHDRVRLAYLSSDFHNHPVAQFAAGVFESHDRACFETFGLATGPNDGSEMRQRLVRAFEHFEALDTLTDAALAARIAELGIEVLIDLGGYTFGSRTRVLAFRPAPIQVSFLGFPGTLGAQCVDYIVADRHVIPEEERAHYAEQVLCLPDTYLPSSLPSRLPQPPPRAEVGLPEDAVVFCSFNSAFKISPATFDSWMRILHAVSRSVLWLRDGPQIMRSNLRHEAQARGVDPARVVFAPRVPATEAHLARFALADLFLDTAPYNAHTTACEALAVAVPVITLRDRAFASRVATGLLHAVGLEQLSTSTAADYERLAIELADTPARLAELKAHLRRVRSSSALFDTARFTRHLEAGLLEAVARQRRGEPPAPIVVPSCP